MMTKDDHDDICASINMGYITEELEPIMCFKCESKHVKTNIVSFDGGHVSEKEAFCESCGQILGYWSFGDWQV